MRKASKTLSAREVFARNLRRARRFKDFTQEQLALEAGLARTYVGNIERGVQNVSIDNMGLLAIALKIPLKDLVDADRFQDLSED